MAKYKNVSEKKLTIPGVGVVEAGGVVETGLVIKNKNFKLEKEETSEKPKQVKK